VYINKLFLLLLLIISVPTISCSNTIKDIEVFTENKPSLLLRHGFNYTLNQSIQSTLPLYISDFRGSFFSERGGDFNGGDNPGWSETNILLSSKKQIPPNTNMIIFKSKAPYNIHYHPKKRKKDNLYIEFHIHYYKWKNNTWIGPILLITKQPYEITWCGDGIVDKYTDTFSKTKIEEICDPGDTGKKNWGDAGCSTKCTPLN